MVQRFPEAHSRTRIVVLTTSALAVASIVTIGLVLPAEYDVDPLGVGRLIGMDRLRSPTQIAYVPSEASDRGAFRRASIPYRRDRLIIPVETSPVREYFAGPYLNFLEYKVRMAAGDTLNYTWRAGPLDRPQQLLFEFHGHTLTDGTSPTVASYEQGHGDRSAGTLAAPFDGIHGWYFENRSAGDVVVELSLSGFYELIEPGEEGNLAGLVPSAPGNPVSAPQ